MSSSDFPDADRQSDFSASIDLAHVAAFVVGRASVRPSTREIVCCGVTHVVEPRVIQVLVALARAKGAILSRDDLTRSCWERRVVGEDAINRVISRLRRLAEECDRTFRIETITKVGYRLIEIGTPATVPGVDPQASPSRPRRKIAALSAGALAIVAIGVAGARRGHELHSFAAQAPPSPVPPAAASGATEPLPSDPQTAAIFLKARADWALREASSINDAISEFGRVITRDPDYAPAYSGLADAYILAREFGTLPDAAALPRAKAAALVALRIDRNLAAAERALGFVLYWGDRDRPASGRAFRKAIALAPAEAQSHFWYANILADNGQFAAATAEFNAARAIDPGSIAIQTDWAWALWSAGQRAQAVADLTAIERDNPDFTGPHDCLRSIYLAERDYRRYLEQSAVLARLRDAPEQRRQSDEEQAAFDRGGAGALAKALLVHAALIRAQPFGDLAWPAFVASAIGDRAALLAALRTADAHQEIRGSAGEVGQIARNWPRDGAVQALLSRRRAARIV
ncbi:hypothetical protein EAH79_13255 [Sphingomonas koreensis]|nr:hypothetical protein EAH79_13255 [Sphingomonas koreensis]